MSQETFRTELLPPVDAELAKQLLRAKAETGVDVLIQERLLTDEAREALARFEIPRYVTQELEGDTVSVIKFADIVNARVESNKAVSGSPANYGEPQTAAVAIAQEQPGSEVLRLVYEAYGRDMTVRIEAARFEFDAFASKLEANADNYSLGQIEDEVLPQITDLTKKVEVYLYSNASLFSEREVSKYSDAVDSLKRWLDPNFITAAKSRNEVPDTSRIVPEVKELARVFRGGIS